MRPTRTILIVLAAVIGVAIAAPGLARAHTDFESSTPTDGAVVDSAVATITVAFTNPATPVGDGFVVLDPEGRTRAPDGVTTSEGRIFELGFDPPLAGGAVGVRWNVRAGDAHPIEGSFSFTVTAPAVTTTTPTTAPQTTAPPTTAGPDATTTERTGADDPTTSARATTSTTAVAVSAADGSEPPTSLEEFLAVGDDQPGETTQRVGRIVSLLAAMLAIGGIAFLASTLRGTGEELSRFVVGVRVAGAALAVGAVISYAGLLRGDGQDVADAWTNSPGAAMALRLLGGVAIALGATAVARSGPTRPASLSAAVSARAVPHDHPTTERSRARWDPRRSPIALAGVALVVISFWFDGHTVSEGNRIVLAALDSVHVVAGAVWVGGVVGFAAIVSWRARREVPTRAAELIVRFSTIAAVALAAVVAAGGLMAFTMLDSLDDLTGTEWGQLLLLKSAAVAVAAGVGAYNHLRLRPALEASPDDPAVAAGLRGTLIAEAIVLTFVVVVTAWLVQAAI
jgi:copper transport protein